MLFAIIFKMAFFKKQPKHFWLSSGSDLTGSDLTIKTELFVLKKSWSAYFSSVHLTYLLKTEFASSSIHSNIDWISTTKDYKKSFKYGRP